MTAWRAAIPVIALLPLLAARPAHAQSTSDWVLLNADRTVVVDGVLLFQTKLRVGSPSFVEPPPISLGTGGLATGTTRLPEVESDRNLAVFRPDEPLVQGGLYSLVTFAPITTFNAGGTLDEQPPSFEVNARLSTATHLLARGCCLGSAPLADPNAPPSCVPVLTETRPSVVVEITAPEDDRSSRQYLYKGVLDEPLERRPNRHWVSAQEAALGIELDPASNDGRYCYRVQAHRLTDGKAFTVARGCFEDEPSEITRSTPSEALLSDALRADNCALPPAGLEAAWCKLNLETCATDPDLAMLCQFLNVQSVCQDVDVPDESLAQLVESGAADAGLLDDVAELEEVGARGQHDRDAGEADAGKDAASEGGGCGVRGAGPVRSGSPRAAALAIFLLGVWRVRRTSREGPRADRGRSV